MVSDVAPEGGIVLSDLSKSYGTLPAVRSLDLVIAPGETVALLGPNGAGKSTTIDMMLGLTEADHGTVSVFGVSPARAVRSGWVGAMLQSGQPLDHLRVRELIALTASYYPAPLDVDDVLRLTGADAFAGQWTSKLSGGQAQRVRFAAALVGDPDLLLLDEPTAGIDVEGRRNFWHSMRDIARQGTTVAVRDALPRGGRCLRRPDRPDRERSGRGRRPGDRDQGAGRVADDQGNAARRGHRGAPRTPRSARG